MRLTFCVVCGKLDNLHHHHIKPRVAGGGDEEDNIITVCATHHGILHYASTNWGDRKKLQQMGIAKRKAAGKYNGIGRKRQITDEQIAHIKTRVDNGELKMAIAKDMKISRESIYKLLKKYS